MDVIALILGGGVDSRLYPLTKYRSKPAVPIGGKYRLVDIPISNCLNSGLRYIYVLTQFNSASLHRHIAQTYPFDVFAPGWVHILAAEQTWQSTDWYLGTADAVRKQLVELRTAAPRDFLVLAGDHLYRMDYSAFLQAHRAAGADITLAVKPVARADAPRFGIVEADRRIVQFHKKPAEPRLLDRLATYRDPRHPYLASMGIYLFRAEVLYRLLETDAGSDFGQHVLPAAVRDYHMIAYPFDGYWEDIGTIRSFYEANLMLAASNPPFSFYDPDRPIYAHPRSRFLPPVRVDRDCVLDRALLAEGCQIAQARISQSVVGVRSLIRPEAQLTRTVTMGADYYESDDDRARNLREGIPDVGIGRRCRIENAIIDKNARIGDDVIIRHLPGREDMETESYVARDGLIIVLKNAVLSSGTIV